MEKDNIVRIETVEGLNKLLFEPEFKSDTGRNRPLYVYRGISHADYQLVTSLQRCCQKKKDKMEENEEQLLNNFAKYAEMEHPGINQSIWKKMIIGQHHGLPTRLMDWTRSPMIALHFATTEGDMDQLDRHDCVVWRLDVEKLNERLPEKYKKYLDFYGSRVFSAEMLENTIETIGPNSQLQQYDEDMKGQGRMVILEPPTIDQRIGNQYSFFSVVPSHVESVEEILEGCRKGTVVKYIIDRNLRWQIRDMLDEGNINERLIYPGLDGIAKWLERRYHVRDTISLSISLTSITDITVDAIICPTDMEEAPKGRLEQAIFDAAGRNDLLKEFNAQKEDYNEPGDVRKTVSIGLKDKSGIKYIYHVLGCRIDKGDLTGSLNRLENLYYSLLERVSCDGCASVGFPLIGSGTGGYKKKAWGCALAAFERFKKTHPEAKMKVFLCAKDYQDYMDGKAIRKQLEALEDTEDLLNGMRLTEREAIEFHEMAQRGVDRRHRRG